MTNNGNAANPYVENFTHDHLDQTFMELCFQNIKSKHSQGRYVNNLKWISNNTGTNKQLYLAGNL